jgi:hypothetical protein
MVALIEPPPPTLPTASTGGTTPSDDDYEAAVIANIHVQAADMHHIRSLISIMLDFSSTHFARWRDNVLLSLRRYSLSLSLLSRANGHHVCRCSVLGPDG